MESNSESAVIALSEDVAAMRERAQELKEICIVLSSKLALHKDHQDSNQAYQFASVHVSRFMLHEDAEKMAKVTTSDNQGKLNFYLD